MFWDENSERRKFVVPDTIVDVAFQIECRSLPLEHAHALSTAVLHALPWLNDEEDAGIHMIYGAESGNGWMRPEATGDGDDVLYLSRRTKLELRVPKTRLTDAHGLTGSSLDIAGHSLRVGAGQPRLLSPITTLFCRSVEADPGQDEETFLRTSHAQLQSLGIRCSKMLCGRSHSIALPDRRLFTRSLMLADLSVEHSILLQQKGLGPGRKLGCGLFLPHKDIKAVRGGDE